MVASTKVCIILEMEVVDTEVNEKIGEPVPWNAEALAASADSSDAAATPAKGLHNNPSPMTSNTTSRVGGATLKNESPAQGFGVRSPPFQQTTPMGAIGRPTPIDSLNPYTNKWTIKARVNSKSEKRTFESKMGPGSLFSVDLSDDTGEIRATFWRESVDRYYPIIEVGKVYLFCRGQLKIANKKFSAVNNQYEINLDGQTQIQLCEDEPASKMKVHYRFVKIADISAKVAQAMVDVIGIATTINPISRLMSTKLGRELIKRTLVLADESGKSIEVTLWGALAESFPEEGTPLVAFKGLRVSDWNEKSLGSGSNSLYEVDPEVEEAGRIKEWMDAGGAATTVSISVNKMGEGGAARDTTSRTCIADVIEKSGSMGSEMQYFNMRVHLSRVMAADDRPIWFAACPTCTKKVLGDESSSFSCENCNWSGTDCSYRYILSVSTVDASGMQYMTAFNDQATALLGKSADELKRLKDENNTAYEAALQRVQWHHFNVRVRAKMDTYNQQTRLKVAPLTMMPVNYATEGKLLLADINQYELPSASA